MTNKHKDPTEDVSTAQPVEEVEEVEPTAEAIAVAEAYIEEDNRDAEWDSLSALGVPREWCVPVQCDLAGYERLTVWFRVNNRYDVARRFKNLTTDMLVVERYKIYSLFLIRIDGWDFRDELTGEPLPAPTPRNIKSYEVLHTRYYDLQAWCRYIGYAKALGTLFDMSTGGNSGAPSAS